MYPDAVKEDKQFKYAQKRNIPIIIKEVKDSLFSIKNINTGQQSELSLSDLITYLK